MMPYDQGWEYVPRVPVVTALPTGPIRGSDPNTDAVILHLPDGRAFWLTPEAAKLTGLDLIQKADSLKPT